MIIPHLRLSPSIKDLGINLFAWIGAFSLFGFIRLYGVEEELVYARQGSELQVLEMIAVQGLVIGTAFGLGIGLLDAWLDRKRWRNYAYGVLILLRTLIHILLTVVILIGFISITHLIFGEPFHSFSWELIEESLFTKTAMVILIYTGVISVIFNLIRQMNKMFGPGILTNIITGKYHRPKEENRVFMFLDLKSSTTYAERLGHILYSELIQDCFFDLTDAVQQHRVEIYQYVGDEAVLTWRIEEGLQEMNCIKAFFSFEDSIQRRANYYFNKYDLVPAFKAGVNMGLVMAAEVGVVKKEIAYHSDVLNTAARIQGQCNALGKPLLVSETVRNCLGNPTNFQIESVGEVSLKGKKQRIQLYSVDRIDQREHPFAFTE
ncbi:MAG: adenylate/guanylate cyclase domain-containing protein [Bacteroidota bacterium]